MNLPKPGKGIWGRKGGIAGGAWGKVGGRRGGLLALLPLLDELNAGEAPDLAVRGKEKNSLLPDVSMATITHTPHIPWLHLVSNW